jgi:hypothetical protein
MLDSKHRGSFGLLWDFPHLLAPRRHVNRGATKVRVSEDARRCSVFVGWSAATVDSPADITPAGTGFLVYAGDSRDEGVYLVTARHVAEKLEADPFVVRLNDQNGEGRLDHIDSGEWEYPTDKTIDIAILRYIPPDWASAIALPASEFISAGRFDHFEVGPGDAVYLVGLFHLHAGKKQNLVTVHAGTISLNPTEEEIPVDDGEPVKNVYLVEMQTLQGASGSPVYIRPTSEFRGLDSKYKMDTVFHAECRDYLLGVWIAAWPGKPDKILAKARQLQQDIWIPVGMGIVVPASVLYDLLHRPDIAEKRREAAQSKSAGNARYQANRGFG